MAYNMTQEAVQNGNNILDDAKNTLKTLKEFDIHVQSSKEKANKAMGRVPEIEKEIDDIIRKSDDSLKSLNEALIEASNAKETAKVAEEKADHVSQASNMALRTAKQLTVKADDLFVRSAELSRDVDRTSDKMKSYEQQAEQDESLVDDALRKANTAKTSAMDAIKKVQNAT
ncbi:hypothetical protein BLA29_012295, partial [Euroglyphus maynei]